MLLWALAGVAALVAAGVVYLEGDGSAQRALPESPEPAVPDDPGPGCGAAAVTDPADLRVDRTLARCGPGAPEPRPLAEPVTLRVAVDDRSEALAPLLVADALGELEAENLAVEIVDLDQRDAYAAMARGEVDVVVGGVDAAFYDAVAQGLDARLVLGGQVARSPSDLDTPQAGLWLRADLISSRGSWSNVRGHTVLVPGGHGAAATYPVETVLGQHELDVNVVSFVDASSTDAAARLSAAEVGAAWLTEPAASRAARDDALRLVATLPGSETIDGTVFSPRLLGPDRDAGLAYARAILRTINTHLADGYTGEALEAVAEALEVPEDEVAAGSPPLFDWEVRAGTTTRLQEAFLHTGAVAYEQPLPEDRLVDRSVVAEVVGEGA
jgi:NitT/TauT family transport system substrate-binding protein